MIEPLSAETLALWRAEHIRRSYEEINQKYGSHYPDVCEACHGPHDDEVVWPCPMVLLLAELDRREALHRWQGRDHQAPVPHLATFTNGWTTQPVTGAEHRRWMAEQDAAAPLRTFADIVEKVTGLREHDGISCCDWATDGPCPWSSQGIQTGLCGPSTTDELSR